MSQSKLLLLLALLPACSTSPSSSDAAVDMPQDSAPDKATDSAPDKMADVSSNEAIDSTPDEVTDSAMMEKDAAQSTDNEVAFTADVWADNWFAMYVEDTLVGEDSVPITTERSFNAETFSFKASYPVRLNVIAKDFKENDSGLEYIGERNQQMGDGGLIVQLKETVSNQVVAVTNATWKCLPIHRAPLNKECEKSKAPLSECRSEITQEPQGWKRTGFDTSGWPQATVHTAQAVGPKDGYDRILWDPQAKLIWGADLETDNTLLCTVTIQAP